MKYDFTPISNIITEMLIKGATLKELGRITEYSMKLIDCEKAYVDNDIQALIEKYYVEKPVELTEHEKACAEKRKDLNEEFARVLDSPEYHANDYVHFKENDGIHLGRVMSYNPATMEYKIYDLDEKAIYFVVVYNIIPKISIELAKELKEEVKKDGEQTEE